MSGMDVDAKHVFDPWDRSPPLFDLAPREENAQVMIERALKVMDAMQDAELIGHLAGVRPLSADRMPIIGRVPGLRGVILATGHGTKGIHLAPITARMVAGLVTGAQDSEAMSEAFLPDRFAPPEGWP